MRSKESQICTKFLLALVTSENPWKNISYHISRNSQDKYQMILVDLNGNIEISQKAAEKMRKLWGKRYFSYGFYFWIEKSGTGPPSAWNKAGRIFGFLFIMGMVAAVIYLVMMKIQKNKSNKPLDINTLKSRIVNVWNSSVHVSLHLISIY